jgi:hypothetical protein
MRSSSGGIP